MLLPGWHRGGEAVGHTFQTFHLLYHTITLHNAETGAAFVGNNLGGIMHFYAAPNQAGAAGAAA